MPDAPLFRDPVFDGATDPTVIRNRETGQWWMFYTQRRASVEEPGVAWVHGSRIGVAVSDTGDSWVYRGVLDGLDETLGPQCGARLARAFSARRILFIGLTGLVTFAALLLLSVALLPQLGLWGFLVPLLGFTTAFGLTHPALSAVALGPHGMRAGTAASVLGASNMAFAACLAPLAGYFGVQTPAPTAAIMLAAAALAATVLTLGFRRPRVR
ncbi:hypothetical protein [Cryobacterium sp.]|uniref:hypothetical protein n=1 Tax=Cryobacterium sp. TaxID=1926290 RepID=UPI00262535B5|nr:hypothetical protein [Cryobacterium sp.]MCU1445737.1 hypothetical protein [Cryobacterium sp.]